LAPIKNASLRAEPAELPSQYCTTAPNAAAKVPTSVFSTASTVWSDVGGWNSHKPKQDHETSNNNHGDDGRSPCDDGAELCQPHRLSPRIGHVGKRRLELLGFRLEPFDVELHQVGVVLGRGSNRSRIV
jgi:hypothetical protein